MQLRQDARLNVSFSILEKNFEKLNSISPQPLIFMIKANAYGHGMSEIFNFVSTSIGQKHFGVASFLEALHLRNQYPKNDSDLFVFSECNISEENLDIYAAQKITPVLHDLRDIETFLKAKKDIPLVIKLDTGMNRLGVSESEVGKLDQLLQKYKVKKIDHLMTHFASAYLGQKDGGQTRRQWESFLSLKSYLSSKYEIRETSVANSALIESGNYFRETDMLRPGLMLYGPQSHFSGNFWKGELISSLEVKALKSTYTKKGTQVGYGGTPLPSDGYITVLPIGYGDGLRTSYSGTKIQFEKTTFEIFGRVNMDLTFLYSVEDPKLTDKWITLWDTAQESLTPYIQKSKTIPYEIFTSLSERIPRSYSHS
jgi:alanine racemase